MKWNLCLAAVAAFAALACAQQAPPAGRGGGRGGRGNPAPQPPSYEVHPDRTVLFRLRAPDATSVKLDGDFLQAPPAVEGAPPPSAARDIVRAFRRGPRVAQLAGLPGGFHAA